MPEIKNILAIIPARGGSKRLPGKNIKMLNGKPLIAYSIEFALNSNEINKVVVSTEDENIAQIAKEIGAEIIKRPIELAQDTTKTAPVLIHAVKELEKEGYTPDVVILLQPTCPIRENDLCQKAIEILSTQKYDSFFTGFFKSYTMATWVKNKDENVKALYDYHTRPRWQDVEVNDKLFGEDGGFYAITYEAFKKYNDFIGNNPYIYEVKKTVDIDTGKDFEKAELIMKG